MKIMMRTLYAGPFGTIHPKQIGDLPETEAAGLIEGGYATAVEAPQVETAVLPEYERPRKYTKRK